MSNQEIENWKTMELDYIDFNHFIDEIMATDIVANYHNNKFKYNQPTKNNFYKFMTGLFVRILPWYVDYWRSVDCSGIHLQYLKQQEQTKDILKNDWQDWNKEQELSLIPFRHNNRIRNKKHMYFDCAVPSERCSKSWKTTTKKRYQYKSP